MESEDWRSLSADLKPGQPYPEGWYAVAMSSEVPADRAVGRPFLDSRIVLYRKANGEPVVLSARCPHMGADLAIGEVLDDEIRCAYHHFRFGADGRCTKIPSPGPIPKAARVHRYASVERFGIVWAYHGEKPLFGPAEVRDYTEGDLLYATRKTNVFGFAPWLTIGNTFDVMHLRHVHGFQFDFDPRAVRYLDDHHIELEFLFDSPELGKFEQRIRVTGTNAVSYVTAADTTTIGLFTSTPIGSTAQTYYVAGVPKDPNLAPAELERRLAQQVALGDSLLADDAQTLQGIEFQVGALVEEDQAMARYMRWVSAFPKARAAGR